MHTKGKPNRVVEQFCFLLVAFVLVTAITKVAVGQESGWTEGGGQRSSDSESQKSVSGFGGMLLITTDQDWQEKWDTPVETTPEFSTTSSVDLGERITILIFLINPLRDDDDQAHVRCDLRVIRPDGSVSADEKNLECFKRVVPDEYSRNVFLAAPFIEWMGEPGDEPGEWITEVFLKDANRGVILDLKTRFTLEVDTPDSP